MQFAVSRTELVKNAGTGRGFMFVRAYTEMSMTEQS